MSHVYILTSQRNSNWSYVGQSGCLDKRLAQHNSGKVRSTKGYRPLNVVHIEEYMTSEEARFRELYLKSGIGREEKQNIVNYSQIV